LLKSNKTCGLSEAARDRVVIVAGARFFVAGGARRAAGAARGAAVGAFIATPPSLARPSHSFLA